SSAGSASSSTTADCTCTVRCSASCCTTERSGIGGRLLFHRRNVLLAHGSAFVAPRRTNERRDGGDISGRQLALPRWHHVAPVLDESDHSVGIAVVDE